MPSTAASIPSKSPSQQVNIEEDEKAIDSARLLSVRMIGVGGAVGAITGVVLSTIGVLNESATVCAVLGYGTGSIISFAAAEINFGVAWSEIPAHVSAWSLPKWIVTVCMVLHCVCAFSNSFVVNQDAITGFLAASVVMALLVAHVRQGVVLYGARPLLVSAFVVGTR
jgi:hypothetical protein